MTVEDLPGPWSMRTKASLGRNLASLEGCHSEKIDHWPTGLREGLAQARRPSMALQEISRTNMWSRPMILDDDPEQWKHDFGSTSIGRTQIARGALPFFSHQGGAHACLVREVTNVCAGIRTHDLPILPLKFELSFGNFRSSRKCRVRAIMLISFAAKLLNNATACFPSPNENFIPD